MRVSLAATSLLVTDGISTSVTDQTGRTALAYATAGNHEGIQALLEVTEGDEA